MSDKSCSERIQGAWAGTRETLYAMLCGDHEEWETYAEENGHGTQEQSEAFSEYGLSFEYIEPENGENGYFCYLMSWGGPSDELRFYVDVGGTAYKIEYWFKDWFDGASIDVTGDQAAKACADWFEQCEMFTNEESAYA
jgi:hypothetical protein